MAAAHFLWPISNGYLHFCADCPILECLSFKDQYQITQNEERVDFLGDAFAFTSLEASGGFWKIPVSDEYSRKMAFTKHVGPFESVQMHPYLSRESATDYTSCIHLPDLPCLYRQCCDFIAFRRMHLSHGDEIVTELGKTKF